MFKNFLSDDSDYQFVITTVKDIVETGVFLRGEFRGGSLKVSITFRNYNEINPTDELIRNIIDELDHCTITDCDKVFNLSRRAFKINFLDDSYKENVNSDILVTDVVALVLFSKLSPSIDWFKITIESYDEKTKREYTNIDIVGARGLVKRMSVIEGEQ